MENYEALRAELIRLFRENPNDQELGRNVRMLVWKMLEKRSKEIDDQNLPGQLNIFGEVKK